MKRFRQGLSLLMVLAMLLGMMTTVPTAYAADGESDIIAETDAELEGIAQVTEEEVTIEPLSSQIPGPDEWVLDAQTKLGTGHVCEMGTDGVLTIKAGSGNGNGKTPATWPAAFKNVSASTALAAVEAGQPNFIEMDVTQVSETDQGRFGVFINYTSPGASFMVGYDKSGWFWEEYKNNAGGAWYNGARQAAPAKGAAQRIRLEWTDTSLTLATVDGKDMFTSMPKEFSAADNTAKGVIAVKAATYGQEITEMKISHVNYTGKTLLTAYDISGVVKDNATPAAPLAGAKVVIGGKETTTDANGAYSLTGFLPGNYTGRVTKEGYEPADIVSFAVVSADITDKDVTLPKTVVLTANGKVTTDGTQGIENALVSVNGTVALTDAQGAYSIPIQAGVTKRDITVIAAGYKIYQSPANNEATDVTLEADAEAVKTISTDTMDAVVSGTYPQVFYYIMKNSAEKAPFLGQTTVLNSIQVNGIWTKDGWIAADVTPVITSAKSDDGKKMTYTITLEGAEAAKADLSKVVIAADMVVGTAAQEAGRSNLNTALADQSLAIYITNVAYPNGDRLEKPLQSIYMAGNSLVSVRSTQSGANLKAGRRAASTVASGDTYYDVKADMVTGGRSDQRYFAGFVSNSELSAGLASNSDFGTGKGGSDNYPVRIVVEDKGDYKSVGLNTDPWYWDRRASNSDSTPQNINPVLGKGIENKINYDVQERNDDPFVRVVIAGDMNDNSKVDWQDGAIAFRDSIMHIPYRGEEMGDVIATRIAMNFGSQAQNPFLTTLDNIKRIALETDGLGQGVMLKGYASEGHDSGHPDYAHIGDRMGGLRDLKTLTKEGKELGARIGIHVNATEFYPEAKAFEEDLVARYPANNSSGAENSLRYGWNWIDQGINMNSLFDMASGKRTARFNALASLIGNYENNDGLDFVYVDVWGNGQGGSAEDAWQTRNLSNAITKNGWRMTHEWSYANPYESTFQHWSSDFAYGDYTYKGAWNSEVLRFVLNNYRDNFNADYSWYGGGANNPLLGGPSMKGFEGWQRESEYSNAVYNIFNAMITTKFLQHFDIQEWENATAKTTLPYATDAGSAQSRSVDWLPENRIALGRGGDEVVVTRGSNGTAKSSYAYATAADKLEYRSRVITFNGKTILKGASRSADFKNIGVDYNQTYLIPWLWDTEGVKVANDKIKLYHWNAKGGDTEWELPVNWTGSVKIYELGPNGRSNEQTVAINNGKITLTGIKKETGYVVVKAEDGASGPAATSADFWSAENMHLSNPSFSGGKLGWNFNGAADIHRNAYQQPMVKFTGEGYISQDLTGLTPGKKYAVYAGVDNRSDAKLYMQVLDMTGEGTLLGQNYTEKSIAKNYIKAYAHNDGYPPEAGGSYYQNMYVFFTAPASGTASLTIFREPGAGNSYVDDVRVVENDARNFEYDSEGNMTKFTQNFENVVQGEYPFVVANSENIEDSRQHLAEKNAPFTQAGWDVKKMNDVLGGDWSLKVNGQVGKSRLVYQTIPQNIRFEPGKAYVVSFKYQMGSPDIYQVVVGDGEFNYATAKKIGLKYAMGGDDATATCTFTIVGAASGQSWFGIYSTGKAPDYQGVTYDKEQNFGGYKEIVLDDVTVTLSQLKLNELEALLNEVATWNESNYTAKDPANTTAWATFSAARTAAQTVMADTATTQDLVDAALAALTTAKDALREKLGAISITVTEVDGTAIPNAKIILEDDGYRPVTGKELTSDSNGKAIYPNMALAVYNVKVVAEGYAVQTVKLPMLEDAKTIEVKAILPKLATATYTASNTDVSKWLPLDPKNSANVTAAAVDGGIKLTFNSSDRSATDIALQDGENTKFANGTVSMEVTPLTSDASRFGVDLRAVSNGSRIYVGPFDAPGYGYEWWGANGNNYSGTASGPALLKGITRHMTLTMLNNSLTLTVDGVVVWNNKDMSTGGKGPDAAPGFIGFNGQNNSGKSFLISNVKIYKTEPKAITVPAVPNNAGKVTVKGTAAAGETVIFSVSTTDGFTFQDVEVKSTTVISTTNLGNGQYAFTMPDEAVTIKLQFTANLYKVTVAETDGGTVEIGKEYPTNGEVSFKVTPNVGCKLLTVTAATASGKTVRVTAEDPSVGENMYFFYMPTEDVTVTATFQKPVAVTGVTLDKTTADLYTNADPKTVTLTATVSPENASNKAVTWSTSNAEVATVADGVVTAVGDGTATITVTTADGSKTATCTVTVTTKAEPPVAVTGVILDKVTAELYTNADPKTVTLTATVSPENASNKAVTWSTSNAEVATVADGVVTAVADGTATITVTTADGSKTATCAVTVTTQTEPPVSVTGVSLDKSELPLTVGGSENLTATVAPTNATNKSVTWSSSDESVATVVNGKITAVKAGTATITVITNDGGFTATCAVTVKAGQPVTPPSSDGGSSNTTTETKKNEDGSTTTTVTDKKTGTVTETTAYPDGTKIVAVTPKDGKTSIEVMVPENKDSVTVTIPSAQKPGAGEVAVIVRPDGTREIVKTSVATENGIRVTLTKSAKLEIIDNTKTFLDVASKDWFAASVQFVASRELFNGTGANTFSPNMPTSRAMLMTVLARLDGKDTSKGESWYSVGMEWAMKTGISDGTNPEANITREQLAAMLYRYAKAGKTEAGMTKFADADQVSSWASEAMAWAVTNGILTGKPGDLLDPQGTASRAEIATMLQRLLKQ